MRNNERKMMLFAVALPEPLIVAKVKQKSFTIRPRSAWAACLSFSLMASPDTDS